MPTKMEDQDWIARMVMGEQEKKQGHLYVEGICMLVYCSVVSSDVSESWKLVELLLAKSCFQWMGISGQDLIVNLSMVFWPFFSRICLLLGEFEGRLGFLKQRWPYYLGFPGSSDSKEFSCSAGNTGSIPGSGRSPGEGNGYPLQYSCLENSMDRGAWQTTVHGVQRAGHD